MLERSALRKIAVRTSMMMMKSSDEMGSPCRSPLACQKLSLALPLTSTWVLADDKRVARRQSQRGPNPRWARISKRKA